MSLLALLVLLIAACLAGYFLPQPINWIIVLIIVVALLYLALGGDANLNLK